jgi:hypothetical protein
MALSNITIFMDCVQIETLIEGICQRFALVMQER